MIRAFIFDLDGVLVQTEKLKAQAYDLAAQKVLGLPETDHRAGEAYSEVVGALREITSQYVVKKLGMEPKLRELMPRYGVSQPWEVLTIIRYQFYDKLVADPQVLRDNQWPYTVAVLKLARETGCYTALTTLSKRKDTDRVISALNLGPLLDLVLTAEDVTCGKPDPEIYLLAAHRLNLAPSECLVLEDSVNGINSAIAAGAYVIAIATPFTNAAIHTREIVNEAWIVHRPEDVADIVRRRVEVINAAEADQSADQ